MDRLKVGIIFGGCCEEHPVSVKSAQQVAKNLDTEKYDPYWIGITAECGETARKYDTKVLIEEAVIGSEVGCAVLGNDPDLITGEVDRIDTNRSR